MTTTRRDFIKLMSMACSCAAYPIAIGAADSPDTARKREQYGSRLEQLIGEMADRNGWEISGFEGINAEHLGTFGQMFRMKIDINGRTICSAFQIPHHDMILNTQDDGIDGLQELVLGLEQSVKRHLTKGTDE